MEKAILSTIGIDDVFEGYRLSDGSVVNIRIMDTGGQENFDAINETYYRDADCCLLVYDITSEKSFDKVKDYYIQKLKDNCKTIIKVLLLGNKTDLKDERIISPKDGAELAQKNGFVFMESSCQDNYNVTDAFTTLIEMTNNELIKTDIKKYFRLKGERKNRDEKKKKKFC